MKKIFVFLLILQCSAGVISAQEIHVVTEDWAPYNYMKDGKIIGIGTEIVEATLEKAGVEGKIEIFPWARAYRKAQREKNVLIYSIVKNKEREHLFKWVGPFAPRNLCLFKLRKRHDITINKIEDAKNYKIAVIRDDVTHQLLQSKKIPGIQAVGNRESKINMLLIDRVDLISGNEVALAFKMSLMGIPFNKVEKALTITEEGGYYMAFSKTTEDGLVNRVKKALIDLKKEGIIQRILDSFLMSAFANPKVHEN